MTWQKKTLVTQSYAGCVRGTMRCLPQGLGQCIVAGQINKLESSKWRLRGAVSRKSGQCPLWVKSRYQRTFRQCPLYPQKRTSELSRGMSALCHKRTHAVQQLGLLLDHLVSERQKIHRELNACGLCGLEVDDELVVCRLLERQISRPRAAKDARGEAGSTFHAFV